MAGEPPVITQRSSNPPPVETGTPNPPREFGSTAPIQTTVSSNSVSERKQDLEHGLSLAAKEGKDVLSDGTVDDSHGEN